MNLIVFWLSASGFLVLAVMRVTDPILPIVASEFGTTIGTAGIIVTAFSIPYGIFQLAFGPLGDRKGKLKVIGYTLAVSSICTVSAAFAPTLETLAFARFLSGITTACSVPLSMAFIADNVPYTSRQPALARYFSGLILGQITGGSLGGIFAELFGWRTIFILFGSATAVVTACLIYSCRNHQETLHESTANSFLHPYIELLKQAAPRRLILTALIEGICFFAGLAFIGSYLFVKFSLNFTQIGFAVACVGVGGLLYIALVKHVVRTLRERGMIIVGGLIMATTFVTLMAIPDARLAYPLLVLMGFGMYTMHNTIQTLATELSPNARGTAVALFAFSLMVGQGIGVSIYGAVIDRFGFPPAYLVTAFVIVLLALWFQSTLAKAPHNNHS